MSTDTVPTDRPDDATAILRPEQPGNASSANMTTTTTDATPPRRGYGALWAKVPREFGFLILTMPIAIIGLVVLSTVFFTGLGLVTIFVGIFLMVAAFYIARGFGTLELIRLRWAGRPEIRRPAWGRDGREQGFWRSAFAPFIDGHYWLYLLHTLVINPIVSIVTWSITIAWTSVALAGTTGWIWQPFIPDRGPHVLAERMARRPVPARQRPRVRPRGRRADPRGPARPGVPRHAAVRVPRAHAPPRRDRPGRARRLALRGAGGRGRPARRVARRRRAGGGRLAPTSRARHPRRPAAAARPTADGPRDDRTPARAGPRLGEGARRRGARAGPRGARRAARAVPRIRTADPAGPWARGRPRVTRVAQPRAGDRRGRPRGCRAARRRSSATRTSSPPSSSRTRRSTPQATAIRLRVGTRDEGPAGHWIDVWVTDNGHGGAAPTPGHGLAGLDERVRGLRGMLVIDSPAGGPTTIGAHVPYVPLAASGTPAGTVPGVV